MTRANPARGEVELELGGETFVLRRSFGGFARLQGACGVEGLGALVRLITLGDMRAMFHGVACLARSGDTNKLADMDCPPGEVARVLEALTKVLSPPTAEPNEKKVPSGQSQSAGYSPAANGGASALDA